jgi:hypothetical protein|nr:MAG TPA: hypothetical protein [Caudoviricetes sp.]
MIKYRLHNITDFGVEIHDFHTENSLNNYIALFVDEPYWVENLYTNKNIYVGFDGESYTIDTKGNKDYIETSQNHKIDSDNVSRETLHESEIDWIKRHISEEEKEPYTKLEKISSFLGILSVIIMATFLLYFFLSSASFIAEHFSEFTWKVFNLL